MLIRHQAVRAAMSHATGQIVILTQNSNVFSEPLSPFEMLQSIAAQHSIQYITGLCNSKQTLCLKCLPLQLHGDLQWQKQCWQSMGKSQNLPEERLEHVVVHGARRCQGQDLQ